MAPQPTTRPDPDRDVDQHAISEHAGKVVAAKAQRDRDRFLQWYEKPLSLKQTLAILAGTVLVVVIGAYLAIAALTALLRG